MSGVVHQPVVRSGWQRARLWFLTTVTIGVAVVVSFSSIKQLAEHAGFGWRAWLFPLLVDAVAAAGYEMWMSRSPARRSAAKLAGFAVVLSLAANVTDWWITSQGRVLSALMGAVPPLMLAWLLYVVHRHGLVHAGVPAPNQGVVGAAEWTPVDAEPNGSVVDMTPLRPVEDEVVHESPAVEVVEDRPGVVRPGLNGAPVFQREPDAAARKVVHQPAPSEKAAAVAPDEEVLVRVLKKQPDLGTMARRRAEAVLTEAAGEKVGSTRAGRLLEAARGGGS